MDAVPKWLVDDGYVDARVPPPVIEDLTEIHPVVKQFVQGIFVELAPTFDLTCFGFPCLGFYLLVTQVFDQIGYRGLRHKALKNTTNCLGLTGVNKKGMLFKRLSQWGMRCLARGLGRGRQCTCICCAQLPAHVRTEQKMSASAALIFLAAQPY